MWSSLWRSPASRSPRTGPSGSGARRWTGTAWSTPPVLLFSVAFVWQTAGGSTVGGSVTVADDWTVQVGLVLGDHSPVKFTIADTTVTLHGLKLGVGIGRLVRKVKFAESFQILGD